MRTRDKKSFPHLEGTILQWQHKNAKNGKIVYVKIAACDYDIGFTLVNAEDPKDNFTCVNGPLSPNKKSFRGYERYDKTFQYLLDCVRNKKIYNIQEKNEIIKFNPNQGSMASCAFSQ